MIHDISQFNDPNIQEFLSLKDKDSSKNNYIIVESEKVVDKLLSSNLRPLKILAKEEFYRNRPQIHDRVDCYRADKLLLQKIVGFNLHHGVFAKAERPTLLPLNKLGNKILILEGLKSPENVGTIIRTATGFGFNSIVINDETCSPYLRRCIRVSMGSIFNCSIHHTFNLHESIEKLKALDYPVFGTSAKNYHISTSQVEKSKKMAVVFGSEGSGMSEDLKLSCDKIVGIPIKDIDSLNVSCAAGIIMYALS